MALRENSEAKYQGTALQIKNRLLIGVMLTLTIGGLAILSGFIFRIYQPDHADETYLLIAILTIGGILIGSFLTLRLLSETLSSINRVEREMIGLIKTDQASLDPGQTIEVEPPIALKEAYVSILRRIDETEDQHLDFLSIVAHEIRSPLATIINYTEIINDPDFDAGPEFFQNSCEVIKRQGLKVCEFTDDILTLAEIDTHRLQMNLEKLRLAPFLEAAAAEAGLQTRRRIIFENHAGDVVVWGDALRIRQALYKLIERCKFHADLVPPISIQLRRSRSENYFEIPVSDAATEFNPSERAVINQCFSTPGIKIQDLHGSWLGLFIANKIIHSHRGDISLSSEPGAGARFLVRMPIAADFPQMSLGSEY